MLSLVSLAMFLVGVHDPACSCLLKAGVAVKHAYVENPNRSQAGEGTMPEGSNLKP